MDGQALRGLRGRQVRAGARSSRELGLTLIEILIVIAILAVVATIGIPALIQELNRIKIKKAISDLIAIEFEIHRYQDEFEQLPEEIEDLDKLDAHPRIDPWGHPYVYFKFGGHGWKGKARKDRFLVPINSSFDLYSIGPDGESRPPLQNPKSFDDIVRANDGAFYGLGRDF